jgi:hypothetical protein
MRGEINKYGQLISFFLLHKAHKNKYAVVFESLSPLRFQTFVNWDHHLQRMFWDSLEATYA